MTPARLKECRGYLTGMQRHIDHSRHIDRPIIALCKVFWSVPKSRAGGCVEAYTVRDAISNAVDDINAALPGGEL